MADLRHRCQHAADGERCPRNRNGASRWCERHGIPGEAQAVLRVLADAGRVNALSPAEIRATLAGQGYPMSQHTVNVAVRLLGLRGLVEPDGYGLGLYRRTKLQVTVRDLPAVFWRRDGRITRVGTADWLESQPRRRALLTVVHATPVPLDVRP